MPEFPDTPSRPYTDLSDRASALIKPAWCFYAVCSVLVLLNGDRWTGSTGLVLAALFLAPFSEEILFRAWLWETIASKYGPILAALATSIAFGILHPLMLLPDGSQASAIIAMMGAYTTMGLLFGYARHKAGVALSIPLHGICNAIYFLLPASVHALIQRTLVSL